MTFFLSSSRVLSRHLTQGASNASPFHLLPPFHFRHVLLFLFYCFPAKNSRMGGRVWWRGKKGRWGLALSFTLPRFFHLSLSPSLSFFIFIPAQTITCSISYTSHLSQFFSLLSFSEFLYISLFLPFSVCLFLFFLFISSLFLPPPLLSFPPFQYLLPFALHLSALSPPHSPSPPRLNFRHTKCSSQITSHDVIAP